MRRDTGSPEVQVILYAIQRGEYDGALWQMMRTIRRRRRVTANVGNLIIALGDTVELFDDLKKPELRNAICRVVGDSTENKIRVKFEETLDPTYLRGRTARIPRDWVMAVIDAE